MTWNRSPSSEKVMGEMEKMASANKIIRRFELKKRPVKNTLLQMSDSVSKPMTVSNQSRRITKLQFLIIKCVAMAVFVWVLAVLQGWASKNSYNPDNQANFKMGIVHGILMPAAFPGLMAGRDLPIYAPNNSGRNYKIGYILGINTCGTIFFAIAFWHPRGLKWKY